MAVEEQKKQEEKVSKFSWKKVQVGTAIIAALLAATLTYKNLEWPTLMTSTAHSADIQVVSDYSKQNRIFNLNNMIRILDEQRHDKQDQYKEQCQGVQVPQSCVQLGTDISNLTRDIDSFTAQLQEAMGLPPTA